MGVPGREAATLGLAHLNTKGGNQSRDHLFLGGKEILERSFIPFRPNVCPVWVSVSRTFTFN
jgi:hypothetical protein